MSTAEKHDEVKIAARLPAGLHRRLKIHSARTGEPLQAIVLQALLDYLKKPQKRLDGTGLPAV